MKAESPKRPVGDSADEAQFKTVVQLLRMKRFEQPDEGFDARNAAAIRSQIAALPERLSWSERLWSVFERTPAPAFRYAMATVFVMLVGYGALTYTQIPDEALLATATNSAPAIAQVQTPMEVAQTNEASELYSKPVFVFEAPSNRPMRGGAQYGTGPTMPVRFDY